MEFIYQPAESNRIGEFLQDGLSGSWTHFRAAVAFVKSSGTRHIEAALETFAQNSDVEIVAGIDHRGSSYEGLKSLIRAVSPRGRVIVFHNPSYRTFHPKVFLFKSQTHADVVVGSGNLTAGGLFANYEASLRLHLNLDEPQDSAFLQQVEDALDGWADVSNGTALVLDQELLDDLAERGLVPFEPDMTTDRTRNQNPDSNEGDVQLEFPFQSRSEPGAPRRAGYGQAPTTPASSQVTDSDESPSKGFVMTLQQTDMGTGQTSTGTSRRSPEVFIPLAARDADPEFWQWPHGFTEDSNRPNKFDRNGVAMRLDNEQISVNMMTWPDRHDFRMRNERIRSSGTVGDILRMEVSVDPNTDYEYTVEVIHQGTTRYQSYLAVCVNPVRNSLKRWGYY